jgi:hypothetical protein
MDLLDRIPPGYRVVAFYRIRDSNPGLLCLMRMRCPLCHATGVEFYIERLSANLSIGAKFRFKAPLRAVAP